LKRAGAGIWKWKGILEWMGLNKGSAANAALSRSGKPVYPVAHPLPRCTRGVAGVGSAAVVVDAAVIA